MKKVQKRPTKHKVLALSPNLSSVWTTIQVDVYPDTTSSVNNLMVTGKGTGNQNQTLSILKNSTYFNIVSD